MVVPFKELAGSPAESYGPEGVTAQRRLLCAWEDRLELITELMGTGYAFGGTRRARYPGYETLLAVRVKVEPFEARPDNQGLFDDVEGQLNRYSGQFAELVVDYALSDLPASLLPLAEPGTVLQYHTECSAEQLDVPAQAFAWEEAEGVPIAAAATLAMRVPVIAHHVSWRRVPEPPWDAIRASVGAVNLGPFLGGEPETILFEAFTSDRQFINFDDQQQPQWAWSLHYVFKERRLRTTAGTDYGWNHSYRPAPAGSPGFDRLLDPAGQTLYRATDFAPLFLSPES